MSRVLRETLWFVVALAVWFTTGVIAWMIGKSAVDGFNESALVRLSFASAAWPLLASVPILAFTLAARGGQAGRRAFRVALIVGLGSAGSGLCAATLVIWTEGHFGNFDPEFIGMNVWLPFVTASLTQATAWGVALDRRSVSFPTLVTLGASALIAIVIALNVPGALNGITPSGLTLVLSLVSAALITALGLIAVIRVGPRSSAS